MTDAQDPVEVTIVVTCTATVTEEWRYTVPRALAEQLKAAETTDQGGSWMDLIAGDVAGTAYVDVENVKVDSERDREFGKAYW